MEKIELQAMEFGAFLQAHTELLLEGNVENVKMLLTQAAGILSGNAISTLAWKATVPYRVINRRVLERPLNWWEHLKRDHAPKWFTKRWPIRTKQEWFEIRELYPSLKLPKGGPVYFYAPLTQSDPDV